MDQPGGGWDCDWNRGLREEGEALRPRFPGGTKTPKSRLKLLAKAAFHNSVSLQVYPAEEQGKLSFPVRDAIIESIKE